MLDTTTKRRIDTARDILVGKVPDPKSQVEQITIALIYKFMDDMDARSEELGGKRAFFSGEYDKYGWKKLMSKELSGFEVLNLYAEAIQKMNLNPNIPQLFRDIFKNAFLPYRDPETLKSFLKIIDDFEYDHSEKLGDAFEYLLSVLGSQGDAGQFRTPRHIIDFMVEVIDPKKEDRILDPACGTAGFLISSYKHIVKHNSSNYNPEKDKDAFEVNGVDLPELTANGNVHYNGDKLTPDERTRLSKNITGYDISPDMVRLSLVNLYLHGFTDPKIYEYDTLTSEDNWNEYADIILANPPFMSPKGGIKPHKRFSIQSSRSEVLFVDYMAEHLTTNGRAAIIVPEGIIFQSGTAYKQLRKMLVDNYLYAVVSLPAGMFNPYSGVKTSILLMDKTLNKKTDNILFVKIENDGFELGAQRRAKTGSQLPQAVKIIKDYISLCHSGIVMLSEVEATLKEKHGETSLWNIATKSKIAEKEEYNLSGERYKSSTIENSDYSIVKLGEVSKFIQGTQVPKDDQITERKDGFERFLRIVDYTQNTEDIRYIKKSSTNTRCNESDIIMVRYGASAGFVGMGLQGIFANNLFKINTDIEKINNRYLYYCLQSENFKNFIKDNVMQAAMPALSHKIIKDFTFPLPPLEIQKEIVKEIEGYQKIIDGARQIVENYKPHIDIDPTWEMIELESICDVRDGTHDSPKYVNEGYPLITSKNIKNGTIDFSDVNLILEEDFNKINKRSKVDKGDIIMPMIGTIGNPVVVEVEEQFAIKNVALIKFFKESKINRYFLLILLTSDFFQNQFDNYSSGSTQKFISLKFIRALKIPLPNIEIQEEIVKKIMDEQNIVKSNNKLISIYEQKIKDRIAKVWGE
ncbi:MAG: N-6 DNA methylase [Melioribacteraceae bacterium]